MARSGELAFTGKSECVRGAHRDLGVDQPGSLTDGYILEPRANLLPRRGQSGNLTVLRVQHAVLSELVAGCMALDKDLWRQHLSPRAEWREPVIGISTQGRKVLLFLFPFHL